MTTHALNRDRLMKLLIPPNSVEQLSTRVYVPLCPIGSYVFRYEPAYGRIIRYRINEIKFSATDCVYDAECYEHGMMIDFKTFNENEIGARFFLSRGSAKRNTVLIEPEDAKTITGLTKLTCKDSLQFKYLSKTGEAYFINRQTGLGMSFKQGVKILASSNPSADVQSLVNNIVNAKNKSLSN